MPAFERRYVDSSLELRAAGKNPRMGGYAAKFDTLSRNLGGFVETIAPRFFNKSAGDGWPDVMARYNHDDSYLLGTTAGRTLTLTVDDVGLDYTVDLPDTSYARDLAVLAERGDVSKSSFAFYTFEDDWSMTDQGFPLRTLLSGQLIDVAPVNMPAYVDTSSGLRSLAEQRGIDESDVARLAAEGKLGDLIKTPATVIDLRGETDDDDGQGDTHPTSRLSLLRREWDLKGKAI
jgi:HK97 family phage prohead protease